MLTARGWWFLIVALVMSGFGIVAPQRGQVLTALGLALILWFAWEWFRFLLQVRVAVPELRFRRRIRSGSRPVTMVWAGRPFEVAVRLDLPANLQIAYLIVEDQLPFGMVPVDGRFLRRGRLSRQEPIILKYTLQSSDPGVLHFEGVRVDVADLQGFFHHRVFLRQPIEITVLPPLVNDQGHQRTQKFQNLLMPPGIHRLRQPGSGSELLDLRDYRPGDPPKMIAWKPSARRDRLITKEFESEVPVRCTLFIDVSQSVRLGPSGRNALARLTALSAALAQSAAAQRDLVGLTLFDEEKTEVLAPARGQRHLIDMTIRLARAGRRAPAGKSADRATLTQLGLRLADEVYPDLLGNEVNRLPWRMYWKPMLDKRWGWYVIALMLSPILVLWAPIGRTIAQLAGALTPPRGLMLPTFILLVLSPLLLGLLIWLVHGLSGFVNPAYYRMGRRKRLAAVIAQHCRLGLGGVSYLCEDDEAFIHYAQRFLADHGIPYPISLFDDHGRYQFRGPAKANVLARALTRAVGRAHDNELFVIMADLFELSEAEMEPLLKAVRVALARHHQVLVVCPWLPGMPPPRDELPEKEWVGGSMFPHLPKELADVAIDQTVKRYHRSYAHVRHEFGRIGVSVIRANHGDPVQLILDRLNRLRGVRVRR